MNNLKHLETHLSAWQPRPPSPRLKASLFGAESPETAPPRRRHLETWRVLTTATACLLLAFVCQHLPEGATPALPAHLILPSNTVSTVDSNAAGKPTLASTNHPQSPSSMGSFQGLLTNGLTY